MSTTAVLNANYQSILQSTEQITYVPGQLPANVIHSETSNQATGLGASSSPPVVKDPVFQVSLVAGAAVLDLYASLKDGGGNTITPTGLSIRALKVQNPNPSPLAITPDSGSNPYPVTITVPAFSETTVFDTGAGGADPTGALSGTANGVWLSTGPTLTVSGAGWTVNALAGYNFIINGVPYTCVSNTATVATMSGAGSVTSATYTWSIVTRALPQITTTARNLTLTGTGTQTSTWTIWLG